MSVALAILWKDLVTEWRSRDRVVAMAVLTSAVVFGAMATVAVMTKGPAPAATGGG